MLAQVAVLAYNHFTDDDKLCEVDKQQQRLLE